MKLPFDVAQFFEVFRAYNNELWPAQVFLLLLGILSGVLVVLEPQRASRSLAAILGLLWLWMGGVYHMVYFSVINPIARMFGAVFIVQALFFWIAGIGTLEFEPKHGIKSVVGWALLVYAVVGYPMVGYLAGHHYPAIPTFGVPCPTTIFTIGMFFFLRVPFPRTMLIIPILWSILGTTAAFSLNVPQDYGLMVAGLFGLMLALQPSRRHRGFMVAG